MRQTSSFVSLALRCSWLLVTAPTLAIGCGSSADGTATPLAPSSVDAGHHADTGAGGTDNQDGIDGSAGAGDFDASPGLDAGHDADANTPDVVGSDADGADTGSADAPWDSGESCPQNQTDCGSGCVDLQTSADHCGSCGHACGPDQACLSGGCVASCQNECPAASAKECAQGGIRECGEFDGVDSCFEWSTVQPCPGNQVCDPTTVTCREPCGDHCEQFSIVLLPDTQYYTSKQSNNASNTYRKQMRWILEHRSTDNIKFVIHLGDVTNNNYDSQWIIADAAHDILDSASMPYSVVPGNHDYLVDGEFDRGGSQFNDYFGQDRFAGKPWYGGGYGSGNTSNYSFFEVGPMKFMVISLEYAPRKDVLCWADDLIAAHPDRRVIIATHCYMTHGAKHATCPAPEYNTIGGSGSTIWEELVARHSNIFMVVSGHIDDSERRQRVGNTRTTVHEMLVDYQFEGACNHSNPASCRDNCRAGIYTGNGWLRRLTFNPRDNTIRADTISVEQGNASIFPGGEPVLFCSELFNPTDPNADGANWYSSDPTHSDHQFTLQYDMVSPLVYAREDLGKTAFLDRTVNGKGDGDQLRPRVAMSPGGSWVAVWEDDSSPDDGAGNFDIMMRGFAPGGCVGFSDRLVNANSAGHQQSPAVAMDSAGNFVVVWVDDADDNGIYQIHGRGFRPNGSERIARFTVNSTATGQQTAPAIAMAPDGSFVVAWEDDPQNNGNAQIMVRGFRADGTQRFADMSVHSSVAGKRIRPAIAMDSTGGFVVAWQDDSDANDTYQIHARGFNADGTQRFGRITVNSVSAGQQRNPAIAMDSTGAFVVAWEDDQNNDGLSQILARAFHADGTQRLADFRVHAASGGHHIRPSISMAPDGGFAIAWQDDGDANGAYNIRARILRANGTEWVAEQTINRVVAGQQLFPDVAFNASGSCVVVWQDDMDNNDAYQILARGLDTP